MKFFGGTSRPTFNVQRSTAQLDCCVAEAASKAKQPNASRVGGDPCPGPTGKDVRRVRRRQATKAKQHTCHSRCKQYLQEVFATMASPSFSLEGAPNATPKEFRTTDLPVHVWAVMNC